jgi:predicted membrane protein
MTKSEAKSAIIRIILGSVLLFGGCLALLFVSLWFFIPAIIGFFLALYSFWAYLVIKEDHS